MTLVVISYAIICWFVNIYADAAEGISTSFLAEYRYAGDYPYMQQAIAVYFYLFRAIETKSNKEAKFNSEAMEQLVLVTATADYHLDL